MKDYGVNNFKAINYQYAVGQLSTCIDLEGCRIKTTMFEKYPSISPYTYCKNNPVMFVDPTGKDVEFNSIEDFFRVGVACLVSGQFRSQFKELVQSDETFVFKGQKLNGSGYFSKEMDGKKYINYNVLSNKKEGSDFVTNLRHESKHAVQYLHGEVGFELQVVNGVDENGEPYPEMRWVPINYDITDEVGAYDAAYLYGWDFANINSKTKWQKLKEDEKTNVLLIAYPELNNHQIKENNSNPSRINSETKDMFPYKK